MKYRIESYLHGKTLFEAEKPSVARDIAAALGGAAMTDMLNDLRPAALSAALRAGTQGWGVHDSTRHPIRSAQARSSRRKCRCGCDQRKTHAGMANGLVLMSGCELSVRRTADF